LYDEPPSPVREVVTYSKEVQTSDAWDGVDAEEKVDGVKMDEELRERIRQEIVEELKQLQISAQEQESDEPTTANGGFFVRELSDEEKAAITASEEFVDFIERSSKVVERALDMEYDVLADYGLGMNGEDEEQAGRKLKEVAQFYDERWSKKRMISDIGYSPKVFLTAGCRWIGGMHGD
jgi:dynein intermediate chain